MYIKSTYADKSNRIVRNSFPQNERLRKAMEKKFQLLYLQITSNRSSQTDKIKTGDKIANKSKYTKRKSHFPVLELFSASRRK